MSNAINIIEKNIEVFQREIKSKCQIDCKMVHPDKADFPIFHPASHDFYEYRFYVGILEWYIREYLVTPILRELFIENGCRVIILDEAAASAVIRFRFSNEEFGKHHPFAFIVHENSKNIAISYSEPDLTDQELTELCAANYVDHIEIIDWTDTDSLQSQKDAWKSSSYSDRYRYTTLRGFFFEHFSDELYDQTVKRINRAVEDANKEIGFNAIQHLSLPHLCDFKADVLNMLTGFPLQSSRYQKFDDEKGEPTSEFYEQLSVDDNRIINRRLAKLLPAFIGKEKFAKCFLTSEHLYKTFKKGNENYFDYSAVATGYFKSVELLLKKIIDLALDCDGHEQLWIKCSKPKAKEQMANANYRRFNNILHVRFVKEKEEEFSTEMGPMVYFLANRTNGWMISESGAKLVQKALLNYTKGCRNEHLHKDIIDDIEILNIIRTNTILCLLCLLGGCKLTDEQDKDGTYIGIDGNSYDNLYKKLNKIPGCIKSFYVQFAGEEAFKAIRLYNQESPKYDERGNIISRIEFVKVVDFHIGDYESFVESADKDSLFFLNRNNVPELIWWVNKSGDKTQILW